MASLHGLERDLVWSGVEWCVVWCGVVWCGVVWCGVVWCGVVWCGVVCGVVWCGVGWCERHDPHHTRGGGSRFNGKLCALSALSVNNLGP